jgi:hypothetical protein
MAPEHTHGDCDISIGTPFSVVALMGVVELIAFAIAFFAFDWMTR